MNSDNSNIHNLPGRQGNSLAVRDEQQAMKPYDYRDTHDERDEDDDEIDLRELWHVILRRKWLILSVAALIFIIALISTLMMTPTYQASATLQINPDDTKVLEYDVNARNQPTNDRDFYQTQYELLQSNTLAQRVIDQLGLESAFQQDKLAKPFFAEQLDNLKTTVKSTLSEMLPENTETSSVDAKELVGERPLTANFLENLSVQPVKNSQIVTISYVDTNPERAATIANALTDNFIDMNLERRRDAATYAEKFLNDE